MSRWGWAGGGVVLKRARREHRYLEPRIAHSQRRRGNLDFELLALEGQIELASWAAGGAGFAGGGGEATEERQGRTHDALFLNSRCNPGKKSTESHDLRFRPLMASAHGG